MNHDPHRDELARLAQQGQARLQAAQQAGAYGVNAEADRNMRIAIGAVRGATLNRVMLALFVVSVLGLIAAGVMVLAADDAFDAIRLASRLAIPCVAASIAFFVAYLYLPPVASDAAVEAERAWIASLPFRFDQYFDVLGAKPESECRLHLELWWAGQGVDGHTLQGIVALFDTQSVVVQPQGGHAAFKRARSRGGRGSGSIAPTSTATTGSARRCTASSRSCCSRSTAALPWRTFGSRGPSDDAP